MSYSGISFEIRRDPGVGALGVDPWSGLSNSARLALSPLIAAGVWGGLAYVLAPKKTKVTWGLGVALGTSLFVAVVIGHNAGLMVDQLGPKTGGAT